MPINSPPRNVASLHCFTITHAHYFATAAAYLFDIIGVEKVEYRRKKGEWLAMCVSMPANLAIYSSCRFIFTKFGIVLALFFSSLSS
jgi:hypothetical protein